MKINNPHSGFHELQNVKCIDANDGNPSKNQGGQLVMQVYDARGNGDGSLSPTITGDHENRVTDYTAICVGNGQLHQTNMDKKAGVLNCMHDQQIILHDVIPPRKYIVRRLTPLECNRLQGFPDGWGITPVVDTMDESDLAFWQDVRRTYALANGKKYKPAKPESMIKWYNGLHTDSAEYKMWGNGIALPCAAFVLHGIAEQTEERSLN